MPLLICPCPQVRVVPRAMAAGSACSLLKFGGFGFILVFSPWGFPSGGSQPHPPPPCGCTASMVRSSLSWSAEGSRFLSCSWCFKTFFLNEVTCGGL